MKNLTILFVLFGSFCCAQIISANLNMEEIPEGINPKGETVLMVDEVRTTKEKNLFVFSKNSNGGETVYVQHFIADENFDYKEVKSDEIKHNGSIKMNTTRKRFVDFDKDKSVDAIFAFSKNDGSGNQETANFVLIHNNDFYTLESKNKGNCNFSEPTKSNNFKNLPKSVQANILEFWSTVDKCFNE